MTEKVRLQKYLASCGVASRRKAEEYISHGRVKINGQTIISMGEKITPGEDLIQFDGKNVVPPEEFVYVLLNKPAGYVTTLSDPQGRPIVTSLVKDIGHRLFPVGRLDLDTEGALILTNDGSLAQKIQHPSHKTNKTYQALVQGHPGKSKLRQLEEGVVIEEKITAPAKVKVVKHYQKQTLVEITLHEGRKRQVKKMFELIGNPVIQLKRISYGKLHLGKLPTGKHKILNSRDLNKIFL
ncbi:pseudouridine synthase [Desulfosediminicola ganghwensis]|uniref:pseudouridine synthase n=1 Tax=Desulfosediminicola ganghwensis TaxID=2569540 RepID=UPI0010AC658A|nr:pseudouridine synthase [Desulfosediminicola ganghwensis]